MSHAVQLSGPAIQRGVALPLRGGLSTACGVPAARGRGAAVLHVLGMGLLFLLVGCLCIAGAAAAYSLKRALSLDIVPGVDMLPDEEIEAAIRAVLALLGF
ncbi:hypothetical protein [Muricoccus aerilatus]|uniref:hypothetical protein n=1 Tax=Muricoccus aerilatus TaxID=452982 RepID=UPI0005C16AAA|nr:hypothetical protein [Roseomonas aerilata]